jgi:hypothetical protein
MAGRSVAGQRHKSWEVRFRGGTAPTENGLAGHGGPREGATWEVVTYPVSGLIAYGGIGGLIAHLTHIWLFFPIGMVFGIVVALGWIVYKYGRRQRT